MNSTNGSPTNRGDGRYVNKERRLSLNYVFWCLLWAICITVSDYTIENDMLPTILVWPMLMLPIVFTLLAFYQYYRYYSGVDELTRKIQSDALVIGFGLGMFILVVYMSLANIGVTEPGANETFAIFAFSGMFGQVFRTWVYNR